MNIETFGRLAILKSTVLNEVPDFANPDNIWAFLGWDEEASAHYELAKAHGIDLRPLLAPEFSEIISIVVDGAYGFPYTPSCFSWNGILHGEVADFQGRTPKERVLAVIDCALKGCLDS